MGKIQSLELKFGAKPENIKSAFDLIYLPSYCYFDEASTIAEEARRMFDETNDLFAVNDFLIAKKNATLAEKYRKQARLSKRFIKRTFENFKRESEMQIKTPQLKVPL